MITIGKTKSVCPECMKVVPAIKGIGEDGIYLVKECNAHGKFQTLIWEGNAADYLSWGRENLSAETPVNPKVKEKSCPDNCGLCEEHERKGCCMILEVTKRCNMHCPCLLYTSIHLHMPMIADGIGVPMENLRIVQNHAGGTFGYKFSPTNEALIGAAVKILERPVSLVFNKFQNITYKGKRSPAFMNLSLIHN